MRFKKVLSFVVGLACVVHALPVARALNVELSGVNESVVDIKTKVIEAELSSYIRKENFHDNAIEKISKLFDKLGLSPCNSIIRGSNNASTGLLMTIATMFGIDESNDEHRYLYVLEKLVPKILAMKDDDFIFREIKYAFSLYTSAFTASSAYRFYPIIGVVHNAMAKQDIFANLPKSRYHDVAEHLAGPWSPSAAIQDLPCPPLIIDMTAVREHLQQKGTVTWLDIGSAFKSEGAPALTVLKEAFPFLKLYGNDISFPFFRLTDSEHIFLSGYVDQTALTKILAKDSDAPTTPFKAVGTINGQYYLNGLSPQYNIFSDDFLDSQRFDFISLCMTFHHLYTEENINLKNPLLLTQKIIVDEDGEELTDKQKTLLLYPSQQKVFDRILEHLEIGGLFFFNHHIVFGNTFYIFQRIGENEYRLYTKYPVVFVNDDSDIYSPQNRFGLIKGLGNKFSNYSVTNYAHVGIQKLLNLTEQETRDLTQWFELADKYNTRYQQWPKYFVENENNSPLNLWYKIREAAQYLHYVTKGDVFLIQKNFLKIILSTQFRKTLKKIY